MKRFFVILFIFFLVFYFAKSIFTKNSENQKTIVKFSSWGSKSEIDITKKLISEFEINNPDIKIEFIHAPQNYFQKIQLMFAAGLEPDVIFINNHNIHKYIKAGLLEDLSSYFSSSEKRFYKPALDCFKYNGGLYALPRDISNLVIYYNKDIFKKYNVKMPDKIKDIYELRELALKTSSKDNWGLNYEENPAVWLYYPASNGGGAVSDDGRSIIINKKESLEALNLYADMINKDKIIPSKAQSGSMTQAQLFINGKLSMYLSGRWMTPKFREVITFDWDTAEFPAPNKVYIDASGWALAKHSKHKKEALRLIKYLSDTDSISKTAQSGLIVPADINAEFQNKGEKPLNCKVFLTMLNNAKPSPAFGNYALVLDIIKDKSEKVLHGVSRAEDVFDDKTIEQLQKSL